MYGGYRLQKRIASSSLYIVHCVIPFCNTWQELNIFAFFYEMENSRNNSNM